MNIDTRFTWKMAVNRCAIMRYITKYLRGWRGGDISKRLVYQTFFCNKTTPHLNGSLTNIFTVINVFRDIIPLRVFSDAFYAFSLLSSLVQRTRIPIPRVITLKYVMMAIISIRNNIDPRWKNRTSSFDIFQKVSWLDYCCTIIFDKREKEFTTRRKIQSRIFRRNPLTRFPVWSNYS